MSETRFTPGPWEADESGFVNCPSQRICQLWDKFEEDFPNSEANARLIAAAPELYEVCKRLLSASESRLLSPSHRAWDEFRAAIAKAEGKE